MTLFKRFPPPRREGNTFPICEPPLCIIFSHSNVAFTDYLMWFRFIFFIKTYFESAFCTTENGSTIPSSGMQGTQCIIGVGVGHYSSVVTENHYWKYNMLVFSFKFMDQLVFYFIFQPFKHLNYFVFHSTYYYHIIPTSGDMNTYIRTYMC